VLCSQYSGVIYNLEMKTKTLNQLENKNYSKPIANDSFLIKRCYELRNVKLEGLAIEDLRILIGQGIGLKYLVPFAIDLLYKDPFAEGDYYPGDLLKNVLQIDANYWEQYPEQKKAIITIFNSGLKMLASLDVADKIKADLYEAFDRL
jgi:hypothetical protein